MDEGEMEIEQMHVVGMAERGGFEPPGIRIDDAVEEFDVIDISKLKTIDS
jgi:hypothetical protein